MTRTYNKTNSLIYKDVDLESDTKLVFLSGLGLGIRKQREGFFRRYALTCGVSYLALDYTHYVSQFSSEDNFRLDTTLPKTLEVLQATKEKLILCGLCYGGAMALKVAAQIPERVSGIVMVAPLYETPEHPFLEKSVSFLMQKEERLKKHHFDLQKLQKVILFRQMIQTLSTFRPMPVSHAYRGSIHIFHGENDNLVPLDNSCHIQTALKNPDVHLHVIPKTGHNIISDFEWGIPRKILNGYLGRV